MNKSVDTHVVGLVPVRSGSRRIKDKNIKSFGDSNLLIRKVRQLQSSSVDSVVVSSDCNKYLKMASQEGAKTHLRSARYADDKSVPFGEVVKKICSEIEGDIVVWAPCVCPFVDAANYNDAIRLFLNKKKEGYDSLISVKVFKEYLWDEDGPINYELGKGHILSQDLPTWYVLTNGIYIADRTDMIEWSYFVGRKPVKYVINKKKAVDIDNIDDLRLARAWLRLENE